MPRKAAPWYRVKAGRWYVTHCGKQTPLPITDPKDVAGAWDAFRDLVSRAMVESGQTRKLRTEAVSVLVAEWLESIRHRVCAKTLYGYGSCLRQFCARFGNRAPAELSAELVEKDAVAQGWSDSHRSNYLWTVAAFLQWCGLANFKVRRPAKESRGAEAVISEEVFGKILRETKGDFYQLMRLLWAVGTRPMESGALTAEMVDWASGTITKRQHKTKGKTGRVRIIYLNSEALAILREQVNRHQTGPLFRGKGGNPLSLHAVMTRMIRLSARIGHHVTAGHFRHTFATRALAAGVPDTHVAALLGHTSTAMIHRHYGHISSNARLLRDAAEKLVERKAG